MSTIKSDLYEAKKRPIRRIRGQKPLGDNSCTYQKHQKCGYVPKFFKPLNALKRPFFKQMIFLLALATSAQQRGDERPPATHRVSPLNELAITFKQKLENFDINRPVYQAVSTLKATFYKIKLHFTIPKSLPESLHINVPNSMGKIFKANINNDPGSGYPDDPNAGEGGSTGEGDSPGNTDFPSTSTSFSGNIFKGIPVIGDFCEKNYFSVNPDPIKDLPNTLQCACDLLKYLMIAIYALFALVFAAILGCAGCTCCWTYGCCGKCKGQDKL